MGGIIGRLLHEFAVTIIVAVLVSGMVSLTLTPLLCSRWLHRDQGRHGRMYQMFEHAFDAWRDAYDRSLRWVLDHQRFTLLLFFGSIVLTVVLFRSASYGLLPNDDTGQLIGSTEGAQDISFDAMAQKQQQAANLIRQSPDVDATMAFIGSGSSSGLNQGRILVRLKPPSERPSADTVLQHLRPKLASIPGFKVFLQNIPVIRIGGQSTKAQYQYTLQDADLEELYQWAPKLADKLSTMDGFLDVNTDQQLRLPKVIVHIDRAHAAALGVTPDEIENALYSAYGARQVSSIYTPSNQYAVIMELLPQFQMDPQALSLLYVQGTGSTLVPLSAVASFERSVGPLSVSHLGQLPSVTVSFNLKPGLALGDAVKSVNRAQEELKMPDTLLGSFQGAAQAFQSSLGNMGLLLTAAILVIYIVLGILYESFVHPITILSGLPSAGMGAVATLMLFGLDVNLYAFVGIIMLIGIVKKNAIMMIDFALEAQRHQNMAPHEAIYQACIIRFRPIMMTTMAALFGTLPIALGIGAGGDSRRPLGLCVVGGLLVSQMLTLYLTPVIYLYLDRLGRRLSRRRGEPPADAPVVAA
ncbi:MAG TPA: efflux RND transporter permease subunit, partial [Nevskiaceae bacterium]|nr:efflux RND transporter permease subunit [Nevskiaceae bacterium]